ncbi:GDSL lipase/acylhydrolase [Tricholoma matsutake]|nr:GDSL lipase/acylhydrolase [Tricholoma matsutake 945]
MKFFVATLWSLLVFSTPAVYGSGVRPGQIKNFVTFGDSYTDVVNTGDHGVAWPAYAAGYAHVSLYPFARSGATCSNNLTYRPFPSVFESQLPQYFQNQSSLKLNPQETVYSLWIGTNDLGVNALLTGSDNASLVNVTTCMVNWVKVLYKSGARNFVFQNVIPLQNLPLFSANSYTNKYWTAQRNTTEWHVFMTELVLSANELTKLKLEALVPTLHGANLALFDSYGLFDDMYKNPAQYLNGTAPLNVTGAVNSCVYTLNQNTSTPGVCTLVNGTAADSYLWYDELHPTEQADRIVAREFAATIEGKGSRWATWLSAKRSPDS